MKLRLYILMLTMAAALPACLEQQDREVLKVRSEKLPSRDPKDEDLKADQVKTELDQYMFYFHRFSSHRSALAVASNQASSVQEKSLRLQVIRMGKETQMRPRFSHCIFFYSSRKSLKCARKTPSFWRRRPLD